MRGFQVAIFSVAVNALVLKSESIAPQKSDSLPTKFENEVPQSVDFDHHWVKRREDLHDSSIFKSYDLSTEGEGEEDFVQKFRDQIQPWEDRLSKCVEGQEGGDCLPETVIERVLEPEDEDWSVEKPYDGPTGDADTEGNQRKHYWENEERKNYARTLRVKLENAAYFLKGFWDTETPNYEEYFANKQDYNYLVTGMEDLGITLRSGSEAEKAYKNGHEEILKIEELSREQCRQKKKTGDICLHFDAEAYKQESNEFTKKVDEKFNFFKAVKPTIEDYPELMNMTNRARELADIGRKANYQDGIAGEMSRVHWRLQRAVELILQDKPLDEVFSFENRF